jgi:hypothetical protein
MSKLTYIFASCIIFYAGCTDANNKIKQSQTSLPAVSKSDLDSTDFYKKFKQLYPAFNLQIDTSPAYENVYTKYKAVDTSNCSSFQLNRIFIGKIESLLVDVKLCEREYRKYHLQSGNLKLWVCSLPEGIKATDKILITAYVYDIMGFERVFGYPAIIAKIYYK